MSGANNNIGQLKLKTKASNNESEAFLNRLFLNTSIFQQFFSESIDGLRTNSNYVKLTNNFGYSYILSASGCNMDSNSVAVSKVLRNWMRLGLGEDVYVSYYDPSPNIANVITFKIDYYVRNKAYPKQDSKQIIQKIMESFNGQFFTRGQSFIVNHNNINFEFYVEDISISLTNADDLKDKDWGILNPTTKIILQKNEGSLIDIDIDGPLVTNKIFSVDWDFENMGIGGLDAEFRDIFRRAFASRVFPPSIVKKLGVNHVKGMLLYGPPGTGKTLIARQIGKMLNGKEPKIVAGPSILNKYVGQSEENIRALFLDAEMEQKQKGDDSGLHIIIFDELDAICKSRGSRAGDTGVGDSIVNQLLTKIDGVESLNNILVIGMTNRKDMIDEALLRPGRLEVHVEISLPDEHGRVQIFKIHTAKMNKEGALASDVHVEEYAKITRNYSGAEIEGVVKSAISYAFSRQVDTKNIKKVEIKPEDVKVTDQDFQRAIKEVRPSFGAVEDQFDNYAQNGIINFGPTFDKLLKSSLTFVEQAKNSSRTPLVSVLLYGKPGSGKSSLASTIAKESNYPFVRIISPNDLIGYNEAAKGQKITKVFEDSYKSPLSCIVVDEIERLIEYVPIGARFSNLILQLLHILLKKTPPKGHKLLVFATTSNPEILKDMDLMDCFATTLMVPSITNRDEFKVVLKALGGLSSSEIDQAASYFSTPITIKQLIMVIEMARQEEGSLVNNIRLCLEDFQLRNL
ncbi:hypothetical protein CYY_002568 [Polysphondylium violaceum]|uniref:Vesicle-fusing ATPase n=1 Tax=Polysphondylium violaceum TaxID=133409 RepID=A0A8J4Q7Q9_9MYCE|nr:hypothetical protein CYY_002568 [Polysphondylium violaceum]